MNKYVIDGLVAEARSGRRVVVATGSVRAARCAFDDAVHATLHDEPKLVRANGRERVTLPNGGDIRFVSVRSKSGRGMAADTVFMDSELQGPDELRHYEDLVPIVASSPTGQIVRA